MTPSGIRVKRAGGQRRGGYFQVATRHRVGGIRRRDPLTILRAPNPNALGPGCRLL